AWVVIGRGLGHRWRAVTLTDGEPEDPPNDRQNHADNHPDGFWDTPGALCVRHRSIDEGVEGECHPQHNCKNDDPCHTPMVPRTAQERLRAHQARSQPCLGTIIVMGTHNDMSARKAWWLYSTIRLGLFV